jgi:outer membrane immunogenic protein
VRRQFFTSVGLVVLLTSVAGAQTSSMPPMAQVTIGPYAGLNFTSFYGDDELQDVSFRTDFALGGQAEFKIANTGFFRTGLVYSRRGAKTTEQDVDVNFKLSYLEVPLLFGYRFPTGGGVQPYVVGGGQMGFKVGCKLSGEQGGVTASIECDSPDFDFDLDVKSFDFAAVGGFGLSVPVGTSSLAFDLRYALGLVKIASDTDTKNHGFTLGVAFMIPVGK